MSKRKTIEVFKIKDIVNATLASPTATQEHKASLCCLLEEVLRITDNYKGFKELSVHPKGDIIEEYSREYF